MVRRRMIIGIALVGLTLALGSNAWADRDRGGRDHRNDKGYHYKDKVPPGHHYGWRKGKGNPHKDRYEYRREHRHRDRDHRWDRDRYRDRHYKERYHRKRVVEKHVYHHYPKRHRYHDDHFNFAVSVIDDFFGFGMAVGGKR